LENNLLSISRIIDYIDLHLDDKLDLDLLASEAGYSKYHLHRMFTCVVGFTVHEYVRRRRLTEAARLLVFTNQPIMDITLSAGYQTQQSFTMAFRNLFGHSPGEVRKKRDFFPLQLKFQADGRKELRGDKIMEVRITESGPILLAGYCASTKNGFAVIPASMKKLEANKHNIPNQADETCLISLNDYSNNINCETDQPIFDFYAAAEVKDFSDIAKGMITKELPPTKYAVFTFQANPQDSLQPVADYIYKEWFPQSTCQFNENNRYDFTKTYLTKNPNGKSKLEYWIPIK